MKNLTVVNGNEVAENEVINVAEMVATIHTVANTLKVVSTKSKKMLKQVTENIQDIMYRVDIEETAELCNHDQKYMTFVYPYDVQEQKWKVNTCSDVYNLIHNSDVFGKSRNILIEGGIEFSESYEIINRSRFYGTFIIEGHDFSIGNGDVIKPIMKVQHSYCGKTKYKLNFGYFRLICSNGMVIPVDEMSEYNFSIICKHTESINKSLEELFAKITYFVNNADIYTENFRLLQNFVIADPKTRIEEVLKGSGIVAVDNKKFNTVNYIIAKMESESADFNLTITDWLIYNAINFYIYNEYRECEAPELKEATDQKVLSFMIKTCKARQIENDETDKIIDTLFEG